MKLRLGFRYSDYVILKKPHLRVGRDNKLTVHNLSWVHEEDSLWATIQSPVLFCPKHRLSRSSNATHLAQRLTSSARPHQPPSQECSSSGASLLKALVRHCFYCSIILLSKVHRLTAPFLQLVRLLESPRGVASIIDNRSLSRPCSHYATTRKGLRRP